MKIKKKVGEKSVKLRKSVTAENLTQCIKKKMNQILVSNQVQLSMAESLDVLHCLGY